MRETWVRFLGEEEPLEKEKWQPTPVFLPGKSHGWRSLAGYSPWGCKQSDTTEWLLSSRWVISIIYLYFHLSIYLSIYIYIYLYCYLGFPDRASGKESACQFRRHKRCEVDPWVGNIPWRMSWQLTSVILPGESHGQKSLVGYSSKSRTWLSNFTHSLHSYSQTLLCSWWNRDSYFSEIPLHFIYSSKCWQFDL